jgi:UDP-N-acetyl-D-glucosamine dehydrogenase
MKQQLLQKIYAQDATIAIIGLGYVGLPLAVAFAENSFKVIGIDVDKTKVDAISRGDSYISDIPSRRLGPLVKIGNNQSAQGMPMLSATTDYAVLTDCDVAIVCVPTPLNKTRDPDVRFLISSGESIAEHMHSGMLVVLESTTYPGTTEELLLPMLAESAAFAREGIVGQDFFLAFSPERIDPGRTDWTVENTPKVVGGITPDCVIVATALYEQAIERVIPVSSTAAAEMSKLLENTFRAVNIALVNEVLVMCDKLGIDAWEVIEAAATKPYGFMKFTPGPGVGGHCIPLDPHYLSWKLKTLNYNARFIQLAGEINTEMPYYWVDRVQDALNDQARPLKGSQVLVLGVAYKKDIDDVRESPALDIIELLGQKGADVRYHDPFVPRFVYDGNDFGSEPDLEAALSEADCVIIVTDHSVYDWQQVKALAQCVVDTRHVMG